MNVMFSGSFTLEKVSLLMAIEHVSAIEWRSAQC